MLQITATCAVIWFSQPKGSNLQRRFDRGSVQRALKGRVARAVVGCISKVSDQPALGAETTERGWKHVSVALFVNCAVNLRVCPRFAALLQEWVMVPAFQYIQKSYPGRARGKEGEKQPAFLRFACRYSCAHRQASAAAAKGLVDNK